MDRIPVRPMATCVAIILALGSPLCAQFITPKQVSPGSSGFTEPDLFSDIANHIQVTYIGDGDLYFSNLAVGFQQGQNITANGFADEHPRISGGTVLSTNIVFAEADPTPGNGNEIYMAQNPAGPFQTPVPLTDNSISDDHPVILRQPPASVDVAWDQTPGTGDPNVMFKREGDAITVVGVGGNPVLVEAGGGNTRIVYARAGAYFSRIFDGISFDAEAPFVDLSGADTDLDVVVDGTGAYHAVFINAGALYYLTDGPGGGTPLQIDAGPVTGAPRIAAAGSAQVAVVYVESGTIRILEGSGGDFTDAGPVAPATAPTAPAIFFDSLGFVHVVYGDSGAIYYTNDVPAPTAQFTATGTSGVLPVMTTFQNQSSGVITSTLWDFGDGTTSTAASPQHDYQIPGPHTVTLTVTGPGGTDVEVKNNFVQTTLPSDYYLLPEIAVFPGQPGIKHPVKVTHVDPLQGFQIVMGWDSNEIPLEDVTFEATITGALSPEFVILNFDGEGANSAFVMAVILDSVAPFDGRTIPPGNLQNFAMLEYDVPLSALIGTSSDIIFLPDGYGSPPISNLMTKEGAFSVLPFLLNGRVRYETLPLFLFLRGDFSFDQAITLVDAIQLLQFLFVPGSPAPVCPDSADFNDSGALDLVDGIQVLNFLFLQGTPPAYPYPGIGMDPTEDSLPPCEP